MLTGLGPQAARHLVERGISLSRVRTFLTLQEGVRFALRQRGVGA
ncbi:hypothetical protein WME99_25500 [Sorangium sp. So ce136]